LRQGGGLGRLRRIQQGRGLGDGLLSQPADKPVHFRSTPLEDHHQARPIRQDDLNRRIGAEALRLGGHAHHLRQGEFELDSALKAQEVLGDKDNLPRPAVNGQAGVQRKIGGIDDGNGKGEQAPQRQVGAACEQHQPEEDEHAAAREDDKPRRASRAYGQFVVGLQHDADIG
jgi:hypothetical protein